MAIGIEVWNSRDPLSCSKGTGTAILSSPVVPVFARLSIASVKHHEQKLGKKGFLGLMIPHYYSSLKEARTGTLKHG